MSRQLLTTAQQDRIAATVTTYLPTDVPVSVLRLPWPRVSNGMGGFREDFETIAAGIPALITPYISRAGGTEAVSNERFEQAAQWKISLPAGTDVIAADRIQGGGREWEVKTVWAVESLEVIRECTCVERLSG